MNIHQCINKFNNILGKTCKKPIQRLHISAIFSMKYTLKQFEVGLSTLLHGLKRSEFLDLAD